MKLVEAKEAELLPAPKLMVRAPLELKLVTPTSTLTVSSPVPPVMLFVPPAPPRANAPELKLTSFVPAPRFKVNPLLLVVAKEAPLNCRESLPLEPTAVP